MVTSCWTSMVSTFSKPRTNNCILMCSKTKKKQNCNYSFCFNQHTENDVWCHTQHWLIGRLDDKRDSDNTEHVWFQNLFDFLKKQMQISLSPSDIHSILHSSRLFSLFFLIFLCKFMKIKLFYLVTCVRIFRKRKKDGRIFSNLFHTSLEMCRIRWLFFERTGLYFSTGVGCGCWQCSYVENQVAVEK